jgi:hypothetical protein
MLRMQKCCLDESERQKVIWPLPFWKQDGEKVIWSLHERDARAYTFYLYLSAMNSAID